VHTEAHTDISTLYHNRNMQFNICRSTTPMCIDRLFSGKRYCGYGERYSGVGMPAPDELKVYE